MAKKHQQLSIFIVLVLPVALLFCPACGWGQKSQVSFSGLPPFASSSNESGPSKVEGNLSSPGPANDAAPLPLKVDLGPKTTGPALFKAGQFSEASKVLFPQINTGDLVAVYYVLLIGRNGLDGRPPNLVQIQNLWEILALRGEFMRAALVTGGLNVETEMVYRTALAELQYFGPKLTSWPPPPRLADEEVRKDLKLALELLLIAEKNNFAPALNLLARLMLEPANGRQTWAFRYTRRAAESGDYLAMGNLSWMFRTGTGVGANNLRAAHWAHQSAQSKPPVARGLNDLAYFYESGRGVTQDLAEAKRWYEKSAAQHHPSGLINNKRLKSGGKQPPTLDNLLMF
ncbi:MAG: tetratricopeptide repeat protein [Candidatus Adiutrix sp.]